MSIKSPLSRQFGSRFDSVFDVVKSNPVYDKVSRIPTLDLDFAKSKSLYDGRSTKNLIDFVRNTAPNSSTYVDAAGLIKRSVTNLLLRSEEFDNAAWTKTRSSITSNTIVAPDGSLTADKITEDATATATHLISQTGTLISIVGSRYTYSVYAKADERNWIAISPGSTWGYAWFDISAGALGTVIDGGGATTASITNVGNGWYRCAVSATAVDARGVQIFLANGNSSVSYTGDGTSGLYLWGAQLEEEASTAGEYVKTTATRSGAPRFDHNPATGESLGLLVEESRQNLLEYSEDISQWSSTTGGSPTITPNADTAPDGTNTATLIENTGVTAYMGDATLYTSGTTYTFSGYFKANDGDQVAILLYSAGAASGFWNSETFNVATNFDLTNGTFTTSSGAVAPTTSTITDAGNGWWRCSITATATSNSSGSNQLIRNVSGVTEGIYAWGYQIEAGAFPTSYIPASGSTVTRAADLAKITGTNFTGFYNTLEGTLYSSFIRKPASNKFIVGLGYDSSNYIAMGYTVDSSTNDMYIQPLISSLNGLPSVGGNVRSKSIISYNSSGASGSINGNSVVSETASGGLPSGSNGALYIGTSAYDPPVICTGTISSVVYYNKRLTNSQLQSLTRQ